MALNLRTFRTRTLTAIVFVIVMLAGLLINHWSYFFLFSIIHFGCWIEYQRLVEKIDKNYSVISSVHRYGIMMAGWSVMLLFSGDSYNISNLSFFELGCWIGLILIILVPFADLLLSKKVFLKNFAHSFFGIVYISLSLGFIMDLANPYQQAHINYFVDRNYSVELPILIIVSLWINDTMAYIVGSFIGKTPFSKISPKKTWEGTIGGMILCILSVYLITYFLDFPSNESINYSLIAAITAITGTAGDLLESKLKRLAGVKDSGSIMPGHGGFLDRFDSLLVAVPFVWIYVMIFMR